jgi:hypothetical protein
VALAIRIIDGKTYCLAARTLLVLLIEARQYSRTSTQYGGKLQNTILIHTQETPPYRLQRVFHMMVMTYTEDHLPMVSPKFGGHTLKGVVPKITGGLWEETFPSIN